MKQLIIPLFIVTLNTSCLNGEASSDDSYETCRGGYCHRVFTIENKFRCISQYRGGIWCTEIKPQ